LQILWGNRGGAGYVISKFITWMTHGVARGGERRIWGEVSGWEKINYLKKKSKKQNQIERRDPKNKLSRGI